MKPFATYQHVKGEPMTKRDEKEAGSKFWNKGKWDNFVLPFLPATNTDSVLIDMGCNAGIFLEEAEKLGFTTVIGVDSDPGAVERAQDYRRRIDGKYEIRQQAMEEAIDTLPVADYTVLANAHYYFTPADWKEYLKKLENKSRYVIIVTADKKPTPKFASSSVNGVREYFKEWKEVGFTDFYTKYDSYPRQLYGFSFKNPAIDRVHIDSLDNGNAQQRGFLEELDLGIDPLKTNYCRRLKSYRKRETSSQRVWSSDELVSYMYDRVDLYANVRKNGLLEPVTVRMRDNRIVDGNHRHAILKHLGYKSVLIRRTP